MTKAERLRKMEELYFVRAFSDSEMAEHLRKERGWELDRTTIYRDRIQMESELAIPFIEEDEGKYRINRSRYVSSIRVDLTEALSLYLAARRVAQQTRFAQRYAASALEKLALALHQPMTERLVKAADAILTPKVDPKRMDIFETVARAWVEHIPLNLDYRGLAASDTRRHRFCLYLIEPAPWSDGVYLIGQSDLMREVTPLKLDRIERASLGTGTFTIPEDFDESILLKHAWGIWRSNREPEIVKLRFTREQAIRRLKESIWHPLEEVIDTADGCIWQAPIAEPQEMIPFIRGWGADCEVVAPKSLRMELMREVKRFTQLYKMEQPDVIASSSEDELDYDERRVNALFKE